MRHEITTRDTAEALGSGDLAVLGTPRMVAWMEAATVEAARDRLDADQTSVGTGVRVRHRRPTPVGGTVEVSAERTSGPDDRGRMTFAVRAVDGDGELVGDGEIDRASVRRADFGA